MKFSVSVRELAEFVHFSGDIRHRIEEPTTALEGVRAQRRYQKRSSSTQSDYQKEVRLSEVFLDYGAELAVSGRADGICEDSLDVCPLVEEIKTTRTDPVEFFCYRGGVHLAQVRIYAAMFLLDRADPSCLLRVTYLNPDTYDVYHNDVVEAADDLRKSFEETCRHYLEWLVGLHQRRTRRNAAAKKQGFPFKRYREGQRSAARGVYRSIRDQENLLLDVPTGAGKTVTTVFPSIKAMGEGLIDRVVYATARTTGKAIAESTVSDLCKSNSNLVSVTVSSKERVCLTPGAPCEAEACEYARGYFDKLPEARRLMVRGSVLSQEKILETSKELKLCPYQFALDLAEWADIVVCDYNHVFDPLARIERLKTRHFRNVALLIDEAHGLSDRVRDSLTVELRQSTVVHAASILTGIPAAITGSILGMIEKFISESALGEAAEIELSAVPKEFWTNVAGLRESLSKVAPDIWENKHFQEFAFQVSRLAVIKKSWNEQDFSWILRKDGDEISINSRCLLAAGYIHDLLSEFRSSVRFSGTLSPARIYQFMHGCEGEPLTAGPPFAPQNLSLLVVPTISTLYRERERTASQLATLIKDCQVASEGNWLVAFPSFAYLRSIADLLEDAPGCRPQVRSSSHNDRAEFISWLNGGSRRVGLVVVGSVFTESIDYDGRHLNGVIVAGPCLPPPSLEQRLIVRHPDMGVEAACFQPGMRKVVQAAGRIVRNDTDCGVVVLVDPRFATARYQEYFPLNWSPKTVSAQEIGEEVREFWRHSSGKN